ncbi:MAG TPA: ATP synthase F0 subunit B [Candidatus Elarobacter sp.]
MESNNTFFVQIALWSQVAGSVAFLIVLILLFRKYLIPAVDANEKARNAQLAEAEARRTRIQTEAAQARGEIEVADRDAAEIRTRVVRVIERDHAHAVAEATAEGERLVRNAEGELERARLAARDRLRIELIEKALAKARAQAAGRVSDAVDKALVDKTVADLARGRG